MGLRCGTAQRAALVFFVAAALGCAPAPSVTPWRPVASVFSARAHDPRIANAPLSQVLAGTWHSKIPCPTPNPPSPPTTHPPATSGTLFVSENSSKSAPIEEYDASGLNPNPLGNIVTGEIGQGPEGMWVDGNGTLYVANNTGAGGGNSVNEYPQGATSPSVTLTDKVYQPVDVAVDSKGDVYVVNGDGGPILVFPPGQTTPTEFSGFKYPTGIAFDSADNLYVVDQLAGPNPKLGEVIKFPPSSQKGQDLMLTRLDYPVGIAIDTANDLVVSNLGNNTITEYQPGQTTPKRVISNGICAPVYVALNASNVLFVANNASANVTAYKPTTHHPFATLTNGMNNPRGVAVNPNWQP